MSSFGGGIVGLAVSTKDVMGALAVLIAIAAYGIYVWKTLRGDARPHPLSWLIFGVLTGTGYLVQLDQKAGPGSWVMAITTHRLPDALRDELLARRADISLVRMGVSRRGHCRLRVLSVVAEPGTRSALSERERRAIS